MCFPGDKIWSLVGLLPVICGFCRLTVCLHFGDFYLIIYWFYWFDCCFSCGYFGLVLLLFLFYRFYRFMGLLWMICFWLLIVFAYWMDAS